MGKSKYPNKLDTSVEIPVIRDNITEIGSDVLNSLRSAIFNIEKTLGINPQGATGNTVASRLNNAIDDNGNITKDALDRSGLLSGPISNADVSKVAGISEEKLKLNFPTQLLQDQISIIDNRIALFIKSLEELNALLTSHIHPDAINRHYAKAITVNSAIVEQSGVATQSLEDGTVQEALEELYNAHINYTGEGVGPENNSHAAGQLYYNNEQTVDIISSSSVQGAIDEIAGVQGKSLRGSILNLNSNGIIRTGLTFDDFEQNDCGSLLVSASEIAWAGPDGSSREIISFFSNPMPVSEIEPFDILTILDSPNATDNKDYLIESVSLTGAGALNSVTVFDGPKFPMEIGINARVSKSTYTVYNENGLNCVARPRHMRSNTPDIQVANPSAATIISSGIRTANIEEASTNILAIEVDGEGHEIDIFNPDLEVQTIETVVSRFNQYSVDNKLNAFAYKVRALKCYELAITHILPNFSDDIKNRTLKIIEASEHDAHEALGLGYILGREVEGKAGNTCHINGKLLSSFGRISRYSTESLFLNIGTTSISAKGVNFLNLGLREGDLCTVDGSTEDSDNGTYRISNVSPETLELDSAGGTFNGALDENSAVFFQRTSASIGELEFSGDRLLVVDVFVTDALDINYKIRAEIIGHIQDANFYAVVTDFSRGFIVDDQSYELKVSTSGMASIRQKPAGSWGEEVYVASTGRYKIFSEDKFNFVILDVVGEAPPLADDIISITGKDEITDDTLHLSRAVYSTAFGFVLGTPSVDPAVPIVLDKRTTGTVDDTIVSENLLERYIQGPRNELRGSGIIRDLYVKDLPQGVVDCGDAKTCYINLTPGVAVVNGVRLEYLGINNLKYNYVDPDTPNFYVAIDGKGCLLVAPEIMVDGDYISPFFNQNVAHIAYVEIDSTWATDPVITDLRLFVDHLDYKVVADITVANDQRFGHFTDIKKAVDYARKFTKMFPDMGTPSIFVKEGEYEIEETIMIDFDLAFRGAGPQTIIKRAGALTAGHSSYFAGSPVFMIGGGGPLEEATSDDITYGTNFENFTYKMTTETIEAFGAAFFLAQSIAEGDSPDASFYFNKIRFVGQDLGASHDANSVLNQPQEAAIIIGPEINDEMVLGNVFITNCYFNWFGLGLGPVYLNDHNEHRNVIATGNIALNVYSSTGTQSGFGYGVLWVKNEADYEDVTGDGNKLTGIVEANNVSDDQY